MSMKGHIVAALNEQFDTWDEFLRSLNEEQIRKTVTPRGWTIKDVVAHMWAWQQRTIARLQAAHLNCDPQLPDWFPKIDPEPDENVPVINAAIYESFKDQPWPQVLKNWRSGYQEFIQSVNQISQRDLIDSGRYQWLNGPLVLVVIGSYVHHVEHLEKLMSVRSISGKT